MDNNFWESLRLGFMQLRADCAIDPPLNPAGRLTAIWTAKREQKWRLNYHKGKDGNGVIERFTWAVESASAPATEGKPFPFGLIELKRTHRPLIFRKLIVQAAKPKRFTRSKSWIFAACRRIIVGNAKPTRSGHAPSQTA